MFRKLLPVIAAAISVASTSLAVEARPFDDRLVLTDYSNIYEVPHELRRWYDRNYPANT